MKTIQFCFLAAILPQLVIGGIEIAVGYHFEKIGFIEQIVVEDDCKYEFCANYKVLLITDRCTVWKSVGKLPIDTNTGCEENTNFCWPKHENKVWVSHVFLKNESFIEPVNEDGVFMTKNVLVKEYSSGIYGTVNNIDKDNALFCAKTCNYKDVVNIKDCNVNLIKTEDENYYYILCSVIVMLFLVLCVCIVYIVWLMIKLNKKKPKRKSLVKQVLKNNIFHIIDEELYTNQVICTLKDVITRCKLDSEYCINSNIITVYKKQDISAFVDILYNLVIYSLVNNNALLSLITRKLLTSKKFKSYIIKKVGEQKDKRVMRDKHAETNYFLSLILSTNDATKIIKQQLYNFESNFVIELFYATLIVCCAKLLFHINMDFSFISSKLENVKDFSKILKTLKKGTLSDSIETLNEESEHLSLLMDSDKPCAVYVKKPTIMNNNPIASTSQASAPPVEGIYPEITYADLDLKQPLYENNIRRYNVQTPNGNVIYSQVCKKNQQESTKIDIV